MRAPDSSLRARTTGWAVVSSVTDKAALDRIPLPSETARVTLCTVSVAVLRRVGRLQGAERLVNVIELAPLVAQVCRQPEGGRDANRKHPEDRTRHQIGDLFGRETLARDPYPPQHECDASDHRRHDGSHSIPLTTDQFHERFHGPLTPRYLTVVARPR